MNVTALTLKGTLRRRITYTFFGCIESIYY